MYGLGNWIATILLAVVSILGLVIWAHAHDAASGIFGAGLMIFSVLMIVRLIAKAFGRTETQS